MTSLPVRLSSKMALGGVAIGEHSERFSAFALLRELKRPGTANKMAQVRKIIGRRADESKQKFSKKLPSVLYCIPPKQYFTHHAPKQIPKQI